MAAIDYSQDSISQALQKLQARLDAKGAPSNPINFGSGPNTATGDLVAAALTRLQGRIDALPDPITLVTLTLSNSTVSEGSGPTSVVGTLSGKTSGSTLTMPNTAGNRFALSGNNIVRGTASLDFETNTTHSITVREIHVNGVNSPKDTVFTITVTNVNEQPNLGALSLSATTYSIGAGTSGTINGATAGSTISSTTLPSGLTIDSAARTWTWSGTGSAATSTVTLIETLADSANSPRSTDVSVTVTAAAPSLNALTLAATTVAENAASGVTISGILSKTGGSTLTLTNDAGGRFALSGTNLIRGLTALDYETNTSHSITIRETLAGATNTPRDTTLTINVTNVFEQANLGALTLSANSFVIGTPTTGSINGATAGSAINSPGLPSGLTINGAARTWAWSGSGSAATSSVDLVETLGDSANSPRTSTFNVTIASSAPTLAALTVASNTAAENIASGAIITGILGKTASSTLTLTNDAGGRFAISGTNLVRGTTALDYETNTNHSITIRETLGGATNSPRDTTLTINVTNINEQPNLGTLTLSSTDFVIGTPTTGAINGATAGSTISATGLPSGLTINGPARTWAWSGSGSVAMSMPDFTETLADSANSPKVTTIHVTVSATASALTPPTLTKTSTDPNKLAFNIGFASDTYAGYYVGCQLSKTSAFTRTTRTKIMTVGDSWVSDYAGYYVGHYVASNPSLSFENASIGGTGLRGLNGLLAREAQIILTGPRVLHIGTGRNDLNNTTDNPTVQVWFDDYMACIDRIKAGCIAKWGQAPKVWVETLVGQQTANSAFNADFNAKRVTANTLLRGAVGTHIDGVIDFAANTSIGDDADMVPTTAGPNCITTDGVHLYSDDNFTHNTGHALAYPTFAAAMNTAIASAPITVGSIVGEQLIFINSEVLLNGPQFTILDDQPDGHYEARVWVESDEPKVSAYSNIVTGEVMAPAVPGAWNPANKTPSTGTLSNSNLTWSYTNSDPGTPASIGFNKAKSAGKFEIGLVLNFNGATGYAPPIVFGIMKSSMNLATYNIPGVYDNNGLGFYCYPAENDLFQNGGYAGASWGAPQTGDDVRILVDVDAKRCWLKINGTVVSGDPVAGTGGMDCSGWMTGSITIYAVLNGVRGITVVPDPAGRTAGFGILG